MKNKNILKLFLIALLITTIAGCSNKSGKYIELFPYRPILVDGIESWEEHADSAYLYSFKYPPEARVFGSSAGGISIDTVYLESKPIINIIVKDPEPFESENPEIAELYKENLETFIEKTCAGEKGFKYHFRSEDAYTFQSSTCERGAEDVEYNRRNDLFFTEYNGLIYEISYDQSPLTSDILSTFNFISEDERPEQLDRSTYEYCLKKFKNQSNREECLRYSYIEEDACKEFTENKSYHAECYWYLALQSKDQSICENLPEETIENVNDKDSVYGILDFNVANCKNAISYTADGVEWNITGVGLDGGISYNGDTILEGWVIYETYFSDEEIPFFHVADLTKLPPTVPYPDYFLQISGAEENEFEYIPAELLEKLKDYDENNMATLSVNKLSTGLFGQSKSLDVVEILE